MSGTIQGEILPTALTSPVWYTPNMEQRSFYKHVSNFQPFTYFAFFNVTQLGLTKSHSIKKI